jgi:hypothetical protein
VREFSEILARRIQDVSVSDVAAVLYRDRHLHSAAFLRVTVAL